MAPCLLGLMQVEGLTYFSRCISQEWGLLLLLGRGFTHANAGVGFDRGDFPFAPVLAGRADVRHAGPTESITAAMRRLTTQEIRARVAHVPLPPLGLLSLVSYAGQNPSLWIVPCGAANANCFLQPTADVFPLHSLMISVY